MKAEAAGRLVEILRKGRNRFVHAERHVPGHTGENEEYGRGLNPKGVAERPIDEEEQDEWEEAEDRDGLKDVHDREHDDCRPLVRRCRVTVRDCEEEREKVRGYHAQDGEECNNRKGGRSPRGVGEQDRRRDSEYDEYDREDPEPPAEAAHLRPQRTGAIYGLSSGPHTPARNRDRIAFCACRRFSA